MDYIALALAMCTLINWQLGGVVVDWRQKTKALLALEFVLWHAAGTVCGSAGHDSVKSAGVSIRPELQEGRPQCYRKIVMCSTFVSDYFTTVYYYSCKNNLLAVILFLYIFLLQNVIHYNVFVLALMIWLVTLLNSYEVFHS